MRRLAVAMLLLALVPGASLGQQDAKSDDSTQTKAAKAKEILKQARDALKNTKLLRYEGKYAGTGWVKQYVPDIEGSAVVGKASEYDLVRFHCSVKLTPPGAEDALELTAGCDGELYFLTDPKAKMVYADIDDAVLGRHARSLQRLLLPEFNLDDPFASELKAEDIQLKEPAQIGGETCDQILVTFPDGRKVAWYIATKDLLPRRVDRFYQNPQQGEASTSLIMTKLVAESKSSLAPFKVKVPEGFTKTDDFPPVSTAGGP